MERISFGNRKGWELVETMMERHAEKETCREYFYTQHLNESGLMMSFEHYLRWQNEHPEMEVPDSVKRIRKEAQHVSWLEQGCPAVENEVIHCKLCGTSATPPKARSLVEVVEAM